MVWRAMFIGSLLALGACGGGDAAPGGSGTNVEAKAVADVDAAMAETLRADQASTAAPPARR